MKQKSSIDKPVTKNELDKTFDEKLQPYLTKADFVYYLEQYKRDTDDKARAYRDEILNKMELWVN